MADELAKRLRGYAECGAMLHPAFCKEAADALDRLTGELANAKLLHDTDVAALGILTNRLEQAEDNYAQAQADKAELAAKLSAITVEAVTEPERRRMLWDIRELQRRAEAAEAKLAALEERVVDTILAIKDKPHAEG